MVLHVHVHVRQMILIQYLTSCSTFHNAYVTYKGLFTRNVCICVCLKIQGMSSVATSDGVHTSSFTLQRQWHIFHYSGPVYITDGYCGTKWRWSHRNDIFKTQTCCCRHSVNNAFMFAFSRTERQSSKKNA